MSKSKISIVDKVYQLAEPIAKKLGLEIWDIKYLKEGADWYLRIFIDNEEQSVSIDDCENMSRAIDEPLDILDAIPNSYCLEVSSPGLERKLEKPGHFKRFMGERVKFKTIQPDDEGKREGEGILKDFKDNIVTINTSQGTIEKNLKDLSYIKLDDFN